MKIIKSGLFVLIMIVVPMLVGVVFNKKNHNSLENIIFSYIVGFVAMIAIYEILCIPMYLIGTSLFLLNLLFSGIVLLLSIVGLVRIIKTKTIQCEILPFIHSIRLSKTDLLFIFIFFVLLAIQIYGTLQLDVTSMSHDDFDYVTQTSASLYSNKIAFNAHYKTNMSFSPSRIFSSWPIFITWFCWLTNLEVVVVCHSLLNTVLLLIAYAIFYLISCFFVNKQEDRYIFMSSIAAVCLFGYHSHYSLTFRLLGVLWQGKAVMTALLVPFLFYIVPSMYKEKLSLNNLVIILFVSIAACSCSMSALACYLFSFITISIVGIFTTKNIKNVVNVFVGVAIPGIVLFLYLLIK